MGTKRRLAYIGGLVVATGLSVACGSPYGEQRTPEPPPPQGVEARASGDAHDAGVLAPAPPVVAPDTCSNSVDGGCTCDGNSNTNCTIACLKGPCSIVCSGGATCDVTCNGDCTVHCQDTSNCNVTGGICGASNGPSNCNAQN